MLQIWFNVYFQQGRLWTWAVLTGHMITYKRSILRCCKFNSKLGRSLYILMWQTNLKDWYLQCWFWAEGQGQWYKWWRESQDQRMSELSLSQISRVACLGSRPIGGCINLRRCNQSSRQIENCTTLKIFCLPAQNHIHARFHLNFSLIFIHFHPFRPLSSSENGWQCLKVDEMDESGWKSVRNPIFHPLPSI